MRIVTHDPELGEQALGIGLEQSTHVLDLPDPPPGELLGLGAARVDLTGAFVALGEVGAAREAASARAPPPQQAAAAVGGGLRGTSHVTSRLLSANRVRKGCDVGRRGLLSADTRGGQPADKDGYVADG